MNPIAGPYDAGWTDEDSCAGSKAKRPRIYALLYNITYSLVNQIHHKESLLHRAAESFMHRIIVMLEMNHATALSNIFR